MEIERQELYELPYPKEEPERLCVPLKMITATWNMGRLASRLLHFLISKTSWDRSDLAM